MARMGRDNGSMQRTVGVDLAADPSNTAAAVLEWRAGTVTLVELAHPCTDDDVLRLAPDALVGVDCALGWPDPFVEFVAEVQTGLAHPVRGDAAAWRRSLAYRITDEAVREVTGRRPLSVSTDRLGLVAMRLASLVAALRGAGIEVRKDARPPLFEVYPGAALRLWGFATRGYRVSAEVRAHIVDDLEHRLPGLGLGAHRELCIEVDHALDAVVAALVARAAGLGRFHPVPDEVRRTVEREGWIVLPSGPIEDLGY